MPKFAETVTRWDHALLDRSREQPAGMWVLLTCLLVWSLCVFGTSRQHAGDFMDDGEYLVAARALRDGSGYTLPSRPGNPNASKYPAGLSLIVAGVLKVVSSDGSLSSDLRVARSTIAAAGWIFFVCSYLWLRRISVADGLAAALVGVVMFHPTTLSLSIAVMSDLPFAALSSVLFLRWANPARAGTPRPMRSSFIDGLLAGAAWLVRGNGFTLVLGSIVAALLHPRRTRRALACLMGVGTVVALSWASLRGVSAPGYSAVYQSQFEVYHSFVGGADILWRNTRNVAGALSEVALPILRTNTMGRWPLIGKFSEVVTLLCIITGALSLFRQHRPGRLPLLVHVALTLGVLVVWPWQIADRMLLGLYPLLLLAFVIGAAAVARAIFARLVGDRRVVLSAAVALCMANVLCMGTLAAWWSWRGGLESSGLDASLGYVKEHLPPNAIVVSMVPELVFLYTGRQGIPMVESTDHLSGRWGRWQPLEHWFMAAPGRPFYLFGDGVEPRQTAALIEHTPYALREVFRTADNRFAVWWIEHDRSEQG